MRYAGGMLGGTWLSLLASDLGDGKFDGAYLVAELREPEPGEHVLGQVLPPVRERRHRAAALSRVRALVGRLLPDERRGDRVDHPQPLRRQQAVAGRGAARPGGATSTCKRSRRRSSCSRRWATTSRRRSRRSTGSADIYGQHRGDQGARPGDRRADAPGHRPPRHLRVRQGGEEGARADRLGAEVDRGAAAGPVRHGDPRDDGRRRQGRIRRDAARAPARGPEAAAEIRSRRRKAVRGGRRAVGVQRARIRAARAARRARGDARMAARSCCANGIRCACSAGGSPIATRCWRRLPARGGDGPRLSATALAATMPGVAPSSCSRNTSARRSTCIATSATR